MGVLAYMLWNLKSSRTCLLAFATRVRRCPFWLDLAKGMYSLLSLLLLALALLHYVSEPASTYSIVSCATNLRDLPRSEDSPAL